MKTQQTSFFKAPKTQTKKWWVEEQNVYGGELQYRKCARPFDSKKLVHIVFKAQALGKGVWFTRSQLSISKLLKKAAATYGFKIKSFSIQKDHIHVLGWFPCRQGLKARESFQNFLRFFYTVKWEDVIK